MAKLPSEISKTNNTKHESIETTAKPAPLNILGNLSFCAGSNTSLDANGSPTATYLWSTGSTNQVIVVNTAGTYTVTVTEGLVVDSDSVVVVELQNPTPSISGNLNFCVAPGSVLDAGAGYANYLWNTGATTQSINVNSSSSFTVTVTDNNTCTASVAVTTTAHTNPTPVISGNLQFCIGFNTTLDAGAGYNNYQWNDGSTSQTLVVSSPGDFTVTVTDANSCTGTASVTIIQNQATATNLTANGPLTFCDGDSVRVLADLGYASYIWSNGVTTRGAKFTQAGSYTVTVTDINGCTSTTSVTINVNPNPVISDVDSTDVDCTGNFTGIFEVIASGGTGPYGYSIDGINYQSNGMFTGLAMGTYTITVVDSATGCVSTKLKFVGEPNPIVANAIVSDNLCYGENFGYVELTVSGGILPYQFVWSNGETTKDITNLVSGTYTVTITDSNGCTYLAAYEIVEPSEVTIGTQQTNVSCSYGADGTAFVDVAGGTPGYTYLWDDGQTDAFAFGLAAGVHTVLIIDANGCDTTMSFTITQPPQLNTTSIETHVTCNGLSDGSVVVYPYGGTPYTVGSPYLISWNTIPVQTGPTATGLPAGIYTAEIIDSAGCIKYHVVAITEPAPIVVAVSVDAVSCNGGNDGEITAAPSGGTPAYTFLWNNGDTNQTATDLIAGTYTVTVTDANGCTATQTAVVGQATAISITGSVINVTCNGGSNGKVTLTVSGGTGGYNYIWNTNPVRTTKNLLNVAAGTYTVIVTDNSGCTASQTFTISQPMALACNGVVTNANCNGGATGSIALTPSGGTAPYTILWSNGNTTTNNNNLLAGTYTVTITDQQNCSASCTYTIAQSASLALNPIVQHVTCNGLANGNITLSPSGGTTPVNYLWSNGSTTATISGLTAGSYTVTASDAAGCVLVQTIVVNEPAPLACVCDANVTHVSCYGGNNGSISAQPVGGTPPYSYQWSNGAFTQTISGLIAGTYTVTITDANGCQTVGVIQVTEPGQLFAVISCVNNASCLGNNNGSACVTGAGGSPAYTYSWNTIPVQTSFVATGLAAGTYTATVTDSKGCTATANVTIEQPSSALTCSATKTNVVCYGQSNGTATANPSGGVAPYTYSWSTSPVKTTKTVLGLSAGSYTVIVTDAAGCTCSSIININQPPQLLALASLTNVSCNGGNNGSANITVTGGTPGYTYLWSNGATTEDVSNLTSGMHQLTITDSKGCVVIVNVVITQPTLLTCTAGSSNASCKGAANGSANVTAAGGTPPYSYLWSNGGINAFEPYLTAGTYTVTVTDSKGCTTTCITTVSEPTLLTCNISIIDNVTCGVNNGKLLANANGGTAPYTYAWSTLPVQTTALATGLAPGSYAVLITDANGCTTMCSSNLGSILTVSCNITSTNVTCNGGNDGTATINPTGGTPPYTYLWNTMAAATTVSVSGLTAGTYIATVTDADGCTSNCSVIITEPTAITVSIASLNVSCAGGNNGSATANPTGGNSAYTFVWSNGQTTQTASGLMAGTYTVTVTDANGCSRQDAVSITEPALLSCSTTSTDVACNGGSTGSATVTANGGTIPYSIVWNTVPAQNTATATGLAAGIYTATVTDANGCTTTCSAEISQTNSTLSCTVTVDNNVSCFGGVNGSLTANPTGGVAPYTFMWSTSPIQTTATATGLINGTYHVTITDANGCTTQCSGTISQPTQLSCNISETHTTCGLNNGVASALPGGGSPGYSFTWSNGATDQSISNLAPGNYTVTVSDANGCTSSCETTINGSTAVIFTVSNTDATCFGNCDGTGIITNVIGGTAPYSYLWSNGQTTTTASALCAGVYTITITDSIGCTAQDSIEVMQPNLLSATFSNVVNVACSGGNNGSAKINPTGGTPSYSYLWSDGQTNQTAVNLAAGVYTVTVTDQNNCTYIDSVTINQSGALILTTSSTPVLCNGGNTGTATANPSGGNTPYTYLWSNGQTNQTATGLAAGSYQVTVTDVNGCMNTDIVVVTEPASLSCSVSKSDPLCTTDCNGFATAVVNGGTGLYQYLWSDGQTTQTATGLCAGSYTVTITDDNACTSSCSTVLVNPAALTCSLTPTMPLCNNSADGSIVNTVNGGTAPYTYLWNNGATTQNLTNITAGTYTATVTDQNGCTSSCSVAVVAPAQLNVTIPSSTNANCGLNNGSATASANGGITPYVYLWSNSQAGPNLINVGAGTYTVTVTDANNCSATSSITITSTTSLDGTISGTNPGCNGGNNGTATIIVTGGDGNYTYSWSTTPVQTNQTATGLSAGIYYVMVTDGSGCTVVDSITLVNASALSCNVTTTPGGCGTSTGTASANATGGTAPLSYLWNNGSTAQSQSGLTGGTYTVTITDANGCTSSCSGVVSGGPAIVNFFMDMTKPSCAGGTDGFICIPVINGGTPPYTYLWNDGSTNSCLNNLGVGVYTVTITDANGCTLSKNRAVIEPPVLTCSTSVIANANCNACNGVAKVDVFGGTPIYNRVWNTSPVQTTAIATGLCAGTYTVTVTDRKGCTTTCTVTVPGTNTLACSITATNNNCAGGNSGQATVAVTGNTGFTETYLWSNGETTATITNLASGVYTVTVTSSSGCTTSCTTTITEPAALSCNILVLRQPTCTVCKGRLRAVPTGGVAPYTFVWNTIPAGTNAVASNLCAGSYTCTITDANGCTTQCTIQLTNQAGPECSISGNTGFCTGSSTQLCAAPNAGYLWSNGATVQCITVNTGGTYTVTVTDVNGCTNSCSTLITEYQAPSCLITGPDSIVAGNFATYCAPSGMQAYLWSNGATDQCINVSVAGTYTVTITSNEGCVSVCSKTLVLISPTACLITGSQVICDGSTTNWCAPIGMTAYLWSTGETTQCVNVGSAGTYTVTITDNNALTSSCSLTLTVNNLPSCLISGSSTVCAGSNTLWCAPSGMSSYLWSTGETTQCINASVMGLYTVTTTDNSGCSSSCSKTLTVLDAPVCTIVQNGTFCANVATPQLCATFGMAAYIWSSGETTRCIEVASPGTYTVTITNGDGCTSSCSWTVNPGTPITDIIVTKTNVSCNGGDNGTSCANTIVGGSAPYTYLWSNGQTTVCATGLSTGLYTVTVTDINGCTNTKRTNITQPATLLSCSTQLLNNASCSNCNGSASVTATGGTAGYSYSWNTLPIQTTQTATGLCAGVYLVTTTDASGCSVSCSITVGGTSAISCTVNTTDASCNGGADGTASVTPSGGLAPYTYLWSNGATTQTISGLAAGAYAVTVTSAEGCTTQCNGTVSEPAAIGLSFNSSDVTCNGGNNGSATAVVNPNLGTETYLWSNGATTATINNLTSGTYTVTVTTQQGCVVTDDVVIDEPTALTCSVSTSAASCGLNNGSASVTPVGGTPGYTYLWSNGNTGVSITNLTAGTYTVTVTDANGCTSQCSGTVSATGAISLSIGKTKVTCFGGSNGTATANPSGSTPPYTYLWSTGQTTKVATGLVAGTYTVTVTSNSGCTASGSVTVLQSSPVIATVTSQSNVSCFGGNNGSVTVLGSGGNAGLHTYLWNTGATTQTLSGRTAGTYTVTVTDSQGCTGTLSVTITQPTQLLANATSTNALCNGTATGSVSAAPTGGTPAYTFNWSNGSSTATVNNLAAGTYTVTVTDANACTATQSVVVAQPTTIANITANATNNVLCNGACNGSIVLNAVTGGTAPYTYLWNNGNTTSNPAQLCAGTYTVTVADANGCTITASFGISQPNALTASTSQTNASSCNNDDGTASVTPTGGTPAYSYLWNNSATSAAISDLTAGVYTVTVTDANGCTTTQSLTITQPAYVCSTFVSGHKETYYAPLGCLNCDTLFDHVDTQFATVFPSGLTVGCNTGFTINLTTAAAVKAFLPSAPSNAALTQNYIDPAASPLDNGLASQMVALALTINFDLADPNFAPTSTVNFRDLVVDSVGPWYGYTVQQIFDEANKQLGGCTGSIAITKSELSSIISRINSSWNLGIKRNNTLTCPPNTCSKMDVSFDESDETFFALTAYPNPTEAIFNLSFKTTYATEYRINMIDMKGSQVINEGHVSHAGANELIYNFENLKPGLYMLQVTIGNEAKTIRVVIQ
ncbi:MAG: T9SS type A sorting domain-containing protein [Bacteroidia bacterium]|nr:T9SS type A sorting domain-containing protein [Bacteroidia bacterium]